MGYMITFEHHGDADSESVDNLDAALGWIKERINDSNYGDFQLFKEIPLEISVSVAVD